jgi:2-hydroxychromene-2-carboxylate isomerase
VATIHAADERAGPAAQAEGDVIVHIEFWFEFASTYSYPAAMRVERLTREAGLTLKWRPFLLGPIFREQGWDTSPFNLYPMKGRYMWRDLERTCEAMGIAFRKPSVFPRNGLLAARIACAFEDSPWVGPFVRAVYAANFGQDRDISDQTVLDEVLVELGHSPDDVTGRALSPESKDRLRLQTEAAQANGIFGAPTFRVGSELFWGNDRLEQAIAWAKRCAGGTGHAK